MKKKTDNLEYVEIDLSDEDLLILALKAHYKDITLNQLINSILKEFLNNAKENEIVRN